MGGTNKKDESKDGKSSVPPPQIVEDHDADDGDIATPKSDTDGDDDQPL